MAGAGGTITYLHRDLLSPRLFTDASGADVGEQGTYPYGESWYNNSSTSNWVFTSYERDPESGDDYALARSYSSNLGRFQSPDPVEGDPGNPQTWNRYAYVGNDPINITDPSGQNWVSDLMYGLSGLFAVTSVGLGELADAYAGGVVVAPAGAVYSSSQFLSFSAGGVSAGALGSASTGFGIASAVSAYGGLAAQVASAWSGFDWGGNNSSQGQGPSVHWPAPNPQPMAELQTDMTGQSTTLYTTDNKGVLTTNQIETRNDVMWYSSPGADAPYRTHNIRGVSNRHAGDPSYGPAGAFIDTGDPRGRAIHGGGNSTKIHDPFAPRQGWASTTGCTRGQNEDVIGLGNGITRFQQANPSVAIPYFRF